MKASTYVETMSLDTIGIHYALYALRNKTQFATFVGIKQTLTSLALARGTYQTVFRRVLYGDGNGKTPDDMIQRAFGELLWDVGLKSGA